MVNGGSAFLAAAGKIEEEAGAGSNEQKTEKLAERMHEHQNASYIIRYTSSIFFFLLLWVIFMEIFSEIYISRLLNSEGNHVKIEFWNKFKNIC